MTFTSELRLFFHLYKLIMGRQVRTFAEVVDRVEDASCSFIPDKVVMKAFELLRDLHWGFFEDLSPQHYPRLWKEMVLPHRKFPEAGDLKRNITISNLYVALLDIHGYTRFCQESKRNLSRMRKLDEFLHAGIRKIGFRNQALAHRERGDEIIVIAATATDAVKTTLEITDTFSRRSVFKGQGVQRDRQEFSNILPDFKVTAGIAGGNLTTPLIITESGLLSGFLINTAARLQSRANELSPQDSEFLVTQSVYKNFTKEASSAPKPIHAKGLLTFFNNGAVAFKGVSITAYEVLYRKSEKYRAKYAEHLLALYDSIRKKLWKEKVFTDLTGLMVRMSQVMPNFETRISYNGRREQFSNDILGSMGVRAADLYREEDYRSAVALLLQIRASVSEVDIFDRLVLDYVNQVTDAYETLLAALDDRLEEEVESKLDVIFKTDLKRAYLSARKSQDTFSKLQAYAYRSDALRNKKALWYKLIEDSHEALSLRIYSGKK